MRGVHNGPHNARDYQAPRYDAARASAVIHVQALRASAIVSPAPSANAASGDSSWRDQ